MKKQFFIVATIFAHAFLHSADTAPRKFSSGGLHQVDICVKKIDKFIDQVSKTLQPHASPDDSFKARTISLIAIADIDSGSPKISETPKPITPLEAKTNLLAAYATLEGKSYHETSPHSQFYKLIMAAQQYIETTNPR